MRYVEEGKYLFIRSGGEIAAQPQVNEVAVVPVPSEFAEEEVMCVIAPIPGESIDPKELLEFLVPRLPHFMVPRYVRIVDALPKTPTQKYKSTCSARPV
jgi:carnitine-CoA ligase